MLEWIIAIAVGLLILLLLRSPEVMKALTGEEGGRKGGEEDQLASLVQSRKAWASLTEEERLLLEENRVRITCTHCGTLLSPGSPACRCGHEFPTVAWDDAMARERIRIQGRYRSGSTSGQA